MIFDVFLAGFTKEKPPVALTDSDLSEPLAALKAGEMTDTIRSSAEWILQQLIEAEATAVIGAAPHERTESRTAQRNGHRPKLVSTAAGDGGRIPRVVPPQRVVGRAEPNGPGRPHPRRHTMGLAEEVLRWG